MDRNRRIVYEYILARATQTWPLSWVWIKVGITLEEKEAALDWLEAEDFIYCMEVRDHGNGCTERLYVASSQVSEKSRAFYEMLKTATHISFGDGA